MSGILRARVAAAWLILCGLLPIAAQAAAPTSQQSIIGSWWEETSYHGYRVISIATIKPDGTYTALFRSCMPMGPVDSVMVGHWTYTNGLMRITKEVNGIVGAIDEYQTETYDGRVWVYRLVNGAALPQFGQVRFRDIRVTPESRLPTCDTLS